MFLLFVLTKHAPNGAQRGKIDPVGGHFRWAASGLCGQDLAMFSHLQAMSPPGKRWMDRVRSELPAPAIASIHICKPMRNLIEFSLTNKQMQQFAVEWKKQAGRAKIKLQLKHANLQRPLPPSAPATQPSLPMSAMKFYAKLNLLETTKQKITKKEPKGEEDEK